MHMQDVCKIRHHFDGYVSDGILSGWIIDDKDPARTFNIELRISGFITSASASNAEIDVNTPVGRYYLHIDCHGISGSSPLAQVYCAELDLILAEIPVFPVAQPCLSDFPFLAPAEAEKMPAVLYTRTYYWPRDKSYAQERERLRNELECLPPDEARAKSRLLIELANLHWKHFQLDESGEMFREALRASPADAELHAAYMEFLYFTAHEELAAQWLERVGPYLSRNPAVERMAGLLEQMQAPWPEVPGATGRIVSSSHGTPRISAVVPNYDYARFLKERLGSILQQTLLPDEIIILDDASRDSSMRLIDEFIRISPVPVRVLRDASNSGNLFIQLIKGIKAAKADLVWVAEADDFCESGFLERLAPEFEDEAVVAAWCDSVPVDDYGLEKGSPYQEYYITLDPHLPFRDDFKLDGTDLLRNGLIPYNCLPNVSAAVFRKSALPENLDHMADFSTCGDWWLWRQLALKGTFAYCARPMNRHRKRRWGSERGVRSGEMLRQHLELHQELNEQKPGLYDVHASVAVSRYLQNEYAAYCYEGNRDAYWLPNSERFGGLFRKLTDRLGLTCFPCFPSLQVLLANEEKRVQKEILSRSSYFDSDSYLRNNPDVRSAGIDPVEHYLATGWKEGRLPRGGMGEMAESFCRKMCELINPVLFPEGYPRP